MHDASGRAHRFQMEWAKVKTASFSLKVAVLSPHDAAKRSRRSFLGAVASTDMRAERR